MKRRHILRYPSNPLNDEHPSDAVMWCGEYVHKYSGNYTFVFMIEKYLEVASGTKLCPDCWQALYERITGDGT